MVAPLLPLEIKTVILLTFKQLENSVISQFLYLKEMLIFKIEVTYFRSLRNTSQAIVFGACPFKSTGMLSSLSSQLLFKIKIQVAVTL